MNDFALSAFGVNGYNDTMERQPDTTNDSESVVFFDGVCGLCNRSVNFFMSVDRKQRLKFAPLQGELATRVVPDEMRNRMDTLVYAEGEQLHIRSTAVARILMTVGGIWKVMGTLLWLIPKPLRDLGYRCVSRLRYRLFGQTESCRMPTPEERGRILN